MLGFRVRTLQKLSDVSLRRGAFPLPQGRVNSGSRLKYCVYNVTAQSDATELSKCSYMKSAYYDKLSKKVKEVEHFHTTL